MLKFCARLLVKWHVKGSCPLTSTHLLPLKPILLAKLKTCVGLYRLTLDSPQTLTQLLLHTVSCTWHSSHELSLLKGTSARVRIRAKLKHISQRSAIIETNQDSLSNGE